MYCAKSSDVYFIFQKTLEAGSMTCVVVRSVSNASTRGKITVDSCSDFGKVFFHSLLLSLQYLKVQEFLQLHLLKGVKPNTLLKQIRVNAVSQLNSFSLYRMALSFSWANWFLRTSYLEWVYILQCTKFHGYLRRSNFIYRSLIWSATSYWFHDRTTNYIHINTIQFINLAITDWYQVRVPGEKCIIKFLMSSDLKYDFRSIDSVQFSYYTESPIGMESNNYMLLVDDSFHPLGEGP